MAAAAKPRKTKTDPNALPTVLSFRRSLELSDAVMKAVGPKGDCPVSVYKHGKRTTAAYEEAKDAGKANKKGDDSRNLVYGYDARLPMDCDTLKVDFNITVLPIGTDPDSCDKPEWMTALGGRIADLRESSELSTLARCYAFNLVNGSWLWRNRDVANGIRVEVQFDDQTLVIDEALDLSLRPVLPLGAEGEDPHMALRAIDGLAEAITGALTGKRKPLVVQVIAAVKLFGGQTVWPSQLYVPEKRKEGGIQVGREFFMGDKDTPLISKEKLGNALRTFDRDHGDTRYPDAIIPIEPNGGSLKFGVNLRKKGVNTAFALLPRFVNLTGDQKPLTAAERRYLLGCLIRGGVYGSKEAAEATAGAESADDAED